MTEPPKQPDSAEAIGVDRNPNHDSQGPDQREGAFISNSTFYGSVIGKQIINYLFPNRDRNNRQRLLSKVQKDWIEDVFTQSLYHDMLIALNLQLDPKAVGLRDQHLVVCRGQEAHPLPPGTTITQVYQQANQRLLILGAPGAGKTTLLLELTQELLNQAKHDESQPVPVVFKLSSWARHRLPFKEWLIKELSDQYVVAERLAEQWLNDNRILLLLDGLDEVEAIHRPDCVAAINQFIQKHGNEGIVVCSRSSDYKAIAQGLLLDLAVEVQPLDNSQIDHYLALAGKPLAGARSLLAQDAALRELVTTPLMLHVLTIVFASGSWEQIDQPTSPEEWRVRLYDRYIEVMFKRYQRKARYTRDQMIRWLAWLARQMQVNKQTIFYPENIQPNWLPEHLWRWYVRILPLLMGVVVGGVLWSIQDLSVGALWGVTTALCVFLGLDIYRYGTKEWAWRRRLRWSIVFGCGSGMVDWIPMLTMNLNQRWLFLLISVTFASIIKMIPVSLMMFWLMGRLRNSKRDSDIESDISVSVGVFTAISIVFGILISHTIILGGKFNLEILASTIIGASSSRIIAFGLVLGMFINLFNGISMIDQIKWSWKHAILIGLSSGIVIGLQNEISDGVRVGLIMGLVAGTLGNKFDPAKSQLPNKGIYLSLRNALWGLVGGLMVATIIGILSFLIQWYKIEEGEIMIDSIMVYSSVLAAILMSLRSGFSAIIQFYLVKIMLNFANLIPVRLNLFLEEASDMLLLFRSGNGYAFPHDTIKDHLAMRLNFTAEE